MTNEFDIVSGMTGFNAIYADRVSVGGVARLTTVEIVHRKRGVRRNFIQTLPVADGFFDVVLVIVDFIIWKFNKLKNSIFLYFHEHSGQKEITANIIYFWP